MGEVGQNLVNQADHHQLLTNVTLPERFGVSVDFISIQEELDRQRQQRFYRLRINLRDDAPPLPEELVEEFEKTRSAKKNYGVLVASECLEQRRSFLKGGISTSFLERMESYNKQFPRLYYDLSFDFVELVKRAQDLENAVNKALRSRGVLPRQNKAFWMIVKTGE